MNKKFSTLLASFLLAGGVFSSAEAALADMKLGEYYKIHVAVTGNTNYYLDSDGPNNTWNNAASDIANDTDGSCWWTAEPVKSTTGVTVGYKLKNAQGIYYVVEDSEGNKYDTFVHEAAEGSVQSIEKWWPFKILKEGDVLYASYAAANSTLTWGFNPESEPVKPILRKADWLNKLEGDGFHMTIGYQQLKDNNTTVDTDKEPLAYTLEEGNVFDGHLYAVQGTNGVQLYQGARYDRGGVLEQV